MSKRFLSIAGALALSLATAGLAMAQDTTVTTTTTTPTTVTQTTQNADGSWTVVEYPVGKEVIVNLTPSATAQGVVGKAKIMRMANGTTITLDATGLTGDLSNLNLYAVDPMGRPTLLGPVNVHNGVGTFNATTTSPLDRFMLVLSPESNLTTYAPTTNVLLRSSCRRASRSCRSPVMERETAQRSASVSPRRPQPTQRPLTARRCWAFPASVVARTRR